MAGYQPMKITSMATGLVQDREEMILPNDAYPTLRNSYVWRERILKKKGSLLLGRLQRNVSGNLGNTDGGGSFSGLLNALLSLETNASLSPGTFTATVGLNSYTEPSTPDGTILLNGVLEPSSWINWATTEIYLAGSAPATPVVVSVDYHPALPVMGICNKNLITGDDQMLVFDQKYCYFFNSATQKFQEFISGTTWNVAGISPTQSIDFFWGCDWWTSSNPPFTTSGQPLFWVTNDSGSSGALADPIRVTDGISWLDFIPPTYGKINDTEYFVNCLALLPYRGRLIAFNTYEGTSFANAQNYNNRIRWSQIGNPFLPDSWNDSIGGKGGFLDIPTTEDITAIGFVRDNIVIYCEQSTWQLRYTGRTIAPFQIEKVNTELGAYSLFSGVQFDTSLVGIGDKGIVECDSYKSTRIDVKIPDLVYKFSTDNNGRYRIHGIRDFANRLAFWTYADSNSSAIFPNRRLVYNYENDSWATFDDDFTCLGMYQPTYNLKWVDIHVPWIQLAQPWIVSLSSNPEIVGGNQQGFVSYLDQLNANDFSLYITAITPNVTTSTVLNIINHNLETGDIISVGGIPAGTPYAHLDGLVFGVVRVDSDNVALYTYDNTTDAFSIPQLDAVDPDPYVGGGLIAVRDNFSVRSKKFNFIDEGRSIQLGYLDILLAASEDSNPGEMSLNVFLDYNDNSASNTLPQNASPDPFFNSVIPTNSASTNLKGGTKFWQRVYCATRSNFLTLEYLFSNAQMNSSAATLPIQIDAQVLWLRKAGNMTQ